MKIVIPVVDVSTRKNQIAGGLNVTGHLCIYDNVSKEGNWMKTTDLAPNMGELLPALERENVTTIISRQVQPMALKVLVNKGFSVYKSESDVLDDNIILFNNNELSLFDMESTMNDAAACGGACNSCVVECEELKSATE